MYQTLEPITLHSGVVTLSEEQARRRARHLERLATKGKDANKYRITGAVQFKAGEQLGIEGDLDKYLASRLEDVDNPQAGTGKGSTPEPSDSGDE